MKRPSKILAIKLRAIGDTVLWTAALHALREAHPEAEIFTLTYATNEAVLQNNPDINYKHFVYTKGRFELVRKLLAMRHFKMDWLLGFHATTSLCRWSWVAGAAQQALHHHSWQRTPRGSVVIPSAGKLEDSLARDHRVLEAMGVKARSQYLAPRIFVTQSERALAERSMRSEILKCGGQVDLPRYLFLPGAGHHLRRYPKEMWLPLAQQILNEGKYQPVVVVDRELSNALGLRSDCEKLRLPLLDHGGLREFISFIALGNRALANDSGPGHIAVGLGLKTIFVFGPGCVGDWHPYDKREHGALRIKVSCRTAGPRDQEQFQYCTIEECSHHRCMRDLHVKANDLVN